MLKAGASPLLLFLPPHSTLFLLRFDTFLFFLSLSDSSAPLLVVSFSVMTFSNTFPIVFLLLPQGVSLYLLTHLDSSSNAFLIGGGVRLEPPSTSLSFLALFPFVSPFLWNEAIPCSFTLASGGVCYESDTIVMHTVYSFLFNSLAFPISFRFLQLSIVEGVGT